MSRKYAGSLAANANWLADIIPTPRKVSAHKGLFRWTARDLVATEHANAALAFAVDLFRGACRQRVRVAPRLAGPLNAQRARIVIGQRDRFPITSDTLRSAARPLPPYLGDEGYRLEITPGRILLIADTAAGIYYGVQTLICLLPDEPLAALPCAVITDIPTVTIRGFQNDFGRGQVPTLDTLKQTVERLGVLKMNAYFLYLEDAFHFPRRPAIGRGRDRLEPAEVRELVAFAQWHHVRIIPIHQTVGHMEGVLGQPEFQPLREGDTLQQAQVLNTMHPGAIPLIEDTVADLCECFTDPFVWAGADEAIGLGTSASAAAAARITRGSLFVGHMKRVREILRRHGKRMAMWTDQVEPDFFAAFGLKSYPIEYAMRIPRDVIMSPWHYNKMRSFPYGETLKKAGFDQVLWGAICFDGRLFPSLDGTADNAYSYMTFVHKLGALGGVASQWDDPGNNAFFANQWPCVALFAETLWTDRPRPVDRLLPAILRFLYGAAGPDLLHGHFVLGRLDTYIPWAWKYLSPGSYLQYYGPLAPHALDAQQLREVRRLLADLDKAVRQLDAASPLVKRNQDLFAFYAFALSQAIGMAVLIQMRHELAHAGYLPKEELAQLRSTITQQKEAFRQLWLKHNKPLGLKVNMKRFDKLIRSLGGGAK
jgi:hexosaminidase